jgi:glycerophosphoryl diester phosphodiesterase
VVDNLTQGSGFIEEMSLTEIKKLQTKGGHSIPTLDEVLLLLDKKVKVHIEIKIQRSSNQVDPKLQEFVSKLGWDFDDFIVSSFFHEELLQFRQLLPEVGVGVLIGHLPKNASFLLDFAPYCVSLDSEFISKEFIDSVHSKGIKLFAYTINTQFELDSLRKMGIDGVFSNFPDRLK